MRFVAVLTACFCVLAGASNALAQGFEPNSREGRAQHLRELGDAYVRAGNGASAVGFYRDALSINPNDARAYEGLARVYLQRESMRDAVETMSLGLRRLPDDVGLWALYSEYLEGEGQLDEAAQALRECITRAPNDPAVQARVAHLAKTRGAWTEALAAYRRVVDLARHDTTVDRSLVDEATRTISALEILAAVDPIHGPSQHCGTEPSPVRRALAGCRDGATSR